MPACHSNKTCSTLVLYIPPSTALRGTREIIPPDHGWANIESSTTTYYVQYLSFSWRWLHRHSSTRIFMKCAQCYPNSGRSGSPCLRHGFGVAHRACRCLLSSNSFANPPRCVPVIIVQHDNMTQHRYAQLLPLSATTKS
jgi:hypothetical protein